MDTEKSIYEMTDEEAINKVIPAWVQMLSWLYDHTFAPVNRFLDHLSGASTRRMIADFEAPESKKS